MAFKLTYIYFNKHLFLKRILTKNCQNRNYCKFIDYVHTMLNNQSYTFLREKEHLLLMWLFCELYSSPSIARDANYCRQIC